MTRLHFYGFSDYDDGKMAHTALPMEREDGMPAEIPTEMPLNIFIDNYEEIPDLPECICYIEVEGMGSGHRVFPSEEAYMEDHDHMKMAVRSLIPVGAFPADENDQTWKPSPHILFTGVVLDLRQNPLTDNQPNYMLLIETLGLRFTLYTRYEGEIQKGYVLQGGAWLFGTMAGAEELGQDAEQDAAQPGPGQDADPAQPDAGQDADPEQSDTEQKSEQESES